VGILRAILVFIKPAFGPVGTAIAGAGSPVPSGTFERDVFGAVRSTLPAMDTPAVIAAFQGHLTFVGKSPVQFDFFTDSRFVFANGLSDGGLGRTIHNAGKYDPPFFQCQVRKRIRITHNNTCLSNGCQAS